MEGETLFEGRHTERAEEGKLFSNPAPTEILGKNRGICSMNVTMATVTQYLQKPSWQEQRETLVPLLLTISPLKLGTPRNWSFPKSLMLG